MARLAQVLMACALAVECAGMPANELLTLCMRSHYARPTDAHALRTEVSDVHAWHVCTSHA
eukprot:5225550-Pleurochrysis_carterae.AAC.1